MALTTSGALIDMLRQHQLLTPEQLAHLPHLCGSRHQDPRTLAKLFLQHGWLTVYQVNELLEGKGHELILGPYQILDRLGQGGQSQVYKARHAEHRWVVALKVLRTEVLASAAARQQFLQEMEAMAEMDHPNIVQFCDLDQVGETFYCAMEFVEGTDLGKLVRLAGYLPPAQAADYVRQTALGLQHAFEHNLVHRDIKPVNLFVTQPAAEPGKPGPPPRGLIKILDWGLACLRLPKERAATAKSPSGCKPILGTADYLSPEQARDADSADVRSDIYSLGCTLYFLLTGQPPFPDGTLMQKLIQHQQAQPAPPERINPQVPAGLAAVVRRMMAKKREDRYQTPVAVAMALLPYCRGGASVEEAIRRDIRPALLSPSAPTRDDTPMPPTLVRKDAPSATQTGQTQLGLSQTGHTQTGQTQTGANASTHLGNRPTPS